MPVNLPLPDPTKLYPVAGVELGFAEVGVRKADRKDLLVIRLTEKASVAGVFTQTASAPHRCCCRKITWPPAKGFVRW